MRTILFRAKALFDDNSYNIKKGKFVYGLFYEECIGGEDCNPFEYVHYMKISYGDHFTETPIDEKTISQFTGLEDKNGKRIFEGDIVKETNVDEEDNIFEVVWDEFHLGFKACTENDMWDMWEDDEVHTYEVIGNIYENSNLLKGE